MGFISRAFSLLAVALVARLAQGQTSCERLKRSLTYTQEEAPRDLSGVLPVVVERVNQVLEGVVNVEVGYHGEDLHGKVGEHLVKCEVTRLASALADNIEDLTFVDEMGRKVITQCFEVPFTILDTNECTLPLHHPMRHQCQSPAVCVNTNGSYDCVCPRMGESGGKYPSGTVEDQFWVDLAAEDRSPWEVSFNSSSRTSCPSMASTHGCCSARTNTNDAKNCRASFQCPNNPCNSAHECASSASCVLEHDPNSAKTYHCQCPDGLMGNGHKCRPGVDPKPEPKVRFDGITPTEKTVKNNFYCDCTPPVVDACAGFPPCKGKHEVCIVTASNVPQCGCEPGYVMHEKYGCVDESPPVMKLRNDPHGDQTLRLKQGDVYKEYAVDIQDENAEEYLRSLKIAYSRPLPHGCLTKVGEFHVNYTIATPWTTPSFLRLTRRVVIEDIDECKLDVAKFETVCPVLIPKCDSEAGASCLNKIGSYTCQCPKYTSGDGFQSGLSFGANDAPVGFKGGNGCHDTSKPVIELKGPNPKIFRISQCGALSGFMTSKISEHDADLKTSQQKHYGDDIKAMIRQTAGAELCATHNQTRPDASDCVKAYDQTYKGRVDLSREVVVGDPTQTSMLQWRVPYDVTDSAGNKAETIWRDIVVEEVDLSDVEAKVRREMLREKDSEIHKAVDKAVADERRKGGGRRNQQKMECPKCPACDCSGGGTSSSFDPSMCDPICDAREQTCQAPSELTLAMELVIFLETYVPSELIVGIVLLCLVVSTVMGLGYLYGLQFGPSTYTPVYNVEERERGLENHIREYNPRPSQNGGLTPQPVNLQSPPPKSFSMNPSQVQGPPVSSSSLYGGPFTPSPRFQSSQPASANGLSQQDQQERSIYAPSPRITPSRRGDGVGNRSPYGR
eukprot:CAMPEP_0172452704 /NCGR_PEP_ID=MMETSP1065-20121228/10284_1 /TAXON_ID=265537 /ORGANISM="Amphiprora paludosa, Strain CCMP125" /LENGTH=900 /DNA_ID=CAMNT_0013204809 /DNA_START=144 /DNA_END=2846 /DNA_ORIENTATION=-